MKLGITLLTFAVAGVQLKAQAQESTAPQASVATSTPSPSKSPATSPTATEPATPEKKPAEVSSMEPDEIEGFQSYHPALQELIRKSLSLTTQGLSYQFGSSDPKAGGMDCSGTIYRILMDAGIKDVPRQSDEICRWVMKQGTLYRTEDAGSLKDATFSALKPGDLLFWTGTYDTASPRELPISHVMLYLGKRKKDGKPVIFGASDGRTYDQQRRNGVSIFDFSLPKRGDKSAFYGYGPVPGLATP